MSTTIERTGAPPSIARAALIAAFVGGVVAGAVDIGAAAAINRMSPDVVLRFVAGGVQGPAAIHGSAASVWLGLVLQLGMSILIAAIFVLASPLLRWLTTRWLSAGLAYGVAIFVVMNYVVMPLSAWHRINHFSSASLLANLGAMLVFGLIVAFVARLFQVRPTAAGSP